MPTEPTEKMSRYWLTPPDLYARLDAEFHFDYDPCKFPPDDNGLFSEWGQSSYVNPPFRKKDGSPTAFVRKAIEENKKGKTVVLTLPTQSYVNLLLEAGAELRSLGRVKWLEVETKEPMKGPSPITAFILKPKESPTSPTRDAAKEDEGKETPNISVPDSAKQATDLMRLRDEFKWAWQAGSFDEKTRLRTIHQDYIDRKIREFNALIDALQEAHSERDSAQEGKA